MNIQLHIERLILDGLSVEPGQRGLVQAAVEAELTRLLATGGLAETWSAGAAMPVLRAGNFPLTMPTEPKQLGGQIANAVYIRIGQSEQVKK